MTTSLSDVSDELWKLRLMAYLQVDDPVFLLDLRGRFIDVNDAAVSLYGWSRNELVGQPSSTITPPARRRHHAYLRRRCCFGKPVRNVESVHFTQSGRLLPVLLTYSLLEDDTKTPVAIATIVKDLSQIKQLEENLQKSQFELRNVQKQLALAAEVQQQLYPVRAPQLDGWDFAGTAFSAAMGCGDYFDFIPSVDGSWWIVVADVSGHGLGSAITMVQLRGALHILARNETDPGFIAAELNRLLVGDVHFATLFLARFVPARGSFAYVAAGHQSFAVESQGRARRLPSTAPPVGVLHGHTFPVTEKQLACGEMLFIPTDGIVEARTENGELFGAARVMKFIEESVDTPANDVIDRVYHAVREFSGNAVQSDDITMVVIRRTRHDFDELDRRS